MATYAPVKQQQQPSFHASLRSANPHMAPEEQQQQQQALELENRWAHGWTTSSLREGCGLCEIMLHGSALQQLQADPRALQLDRRLSCIISRSPSYKSADSILA